MSVSSRSSTSVSGFDESCKGGRNGLILLTRPRGYSASFDCCCLEDYWSISWGYSLFFYCKNNEMNIISGFVLALNIWYNKYGLDRIEQTHCGLFFTDLKQSSKLKTYILQSFYPIQTELTMGIWRFLELISKAYNGLMVFDIKSKLYLSCRYEAFFLPNRTYL